LKRKASTGSVPPNLDSEIIELKIKIKVIKDWIEPGEP